MAHKTTPRPRPARGTARQPTYRDVLRAAREQAVRRYLREVLRSRRGNVTHAAATAGLERESFYRLLRRHGIRPDDYRR